MPVVATEHPTRDRGLGRTAVLVTIVLLAGGCGGGDNGRDRAAATRILVTADDVPGFTKVRGPSGWPPVYAACAGDPLLPGRDSSDLPFASFLRDETPVLRKLQVDGVESYAVLAGTEAEAERPVALLADPGFRTCVQRGLEVAQEETVENKQVIGSSITDLPTAALGDGVTVAAFRVTVDEEFHHIDHELTVVHKGRALAFLFTGRLGIDSYPDSERQRLASVLAGRMP